MSKVPPERVDALRSGSQPCLDVVLHGRLGLEGRQLTRAGPADQAWEFDPERREQLLLHPTHAFSLPRLEVVMAEKVRNSMGHQDDQLVVQAVLLLCGLSCRRLNADRDVAKQRACCSILWKRQHVGRPLLSPPVEIQTGDERVIAENDRQLYVRT